MARKINAELSEINQLIGKQIALARVDLGLSRQQLAKTLNLTHQQISKYESGVDKISAARLSELAKTLQQPITFFYDKSLIEEGLDINRTQHLGLIRSFRAIEDNEQRKAILKLMYTMRKKEQDDE